MNDFSPVRTFSFFGRLHASNERSHSWRLTGLPRLYVFRPSVTASEFVLGLDKSPCQLFFRGISWIISRALNSSWLDGHVPERVFAELAFSLRAMALDSCTRSQTNRVFLCGTKHVVPYRSSSPLKPPFQMFPFRTLFGLITLFYSPPRFRERNFLFGEGRSSARRKVDRFS